MFLGTDLSWSDHIDLIISKTNEILGIIYKTCTNDCDQKTSLILYKSLVRYTTLKKKSRHLSVLKDVLPNFKLEM